MKEIKKSIKRITKYIVGELGNELISLYVGGSALVKPCPTSDIDFYAVMQPSFNLIKSSLLNLKLKIKKIPNAKYAKIKYVLISELEGKTKSKFTKDELFRIRIRYMPNWKLVYGKKLNFSKFPIKPLTYKEELKFQINRALQSIKNMKRGTYIYGFNNFVKNILHCAKLEAVLRYGLKYDCTFHGIVKKFKKYKDHIVHEAWKLRMAEKVTQQDKNQFIKLAKSYLNKLNKEILKSK